MADETFELHIKTSWWVRWVLLPLAWLMGRTGLWSDVPEWLVGMAKRGCLYRISSRGKWYSLSRRARRDADA